MRFEIKYIVHRSKLDPLREMIQPFVKVDKHARSRKNKSYTVRSVYFDTPDHLYYREKMEGVPYRLKLRIRSYDTPEYAAPVFFEIKRKHRVPMTKDRASYRLHELLDILKTGDVDKYAHRVKPDATVSAQRFLYHLHKHHLSPTVLVVYDREPYEAILDKTIRITFDKALRSTIAHDVNDIYTDELKPVMQDHFILEVKYNTAYPSWMQLIANNLNIKQVSASKYCMSVDNHPELIPDEQWSKLVSFRRSLYESA